MSCHHPGKTLLEHYMQPNQLSQNKLAREIGVPPRRINEIILGKRAITADTAVRLASYFGNSASYWMHIQSEYDITQAREKLGQRLHMIQTLPARKPELETEKTDSANPAQTTNIKRRLMR